MGDQKVLKKKSSDLVLFMFIRFMKAARDEKNIIPRRNGSTSGEKLGRLLNSKNGAISISTGQRENEHYVQAQKNEINVHWGEWMDG